MNRKIAFLFVMVGCCLPLSALFSQKLPLEQLEGLRIRNVGPAGMSGRVTTIDVVLDQPNHIFAGTASGGVWHSSSGGIHWEPIFDDQPVQSIGALAINQDNPDEIWVGTGEGNPRNSANSGSGIFKSIDGGKHWTRMGLEETRTIHRIIIHRDDPKVVYVAAQGSAWGNNPERGVYRTTDGGKSWDKVLYIDDSTGCADLVVDPRNPNKLIAAMWTYGRKPWTFNSGGPGSGIYVSFDGGDHWERRTHKDGLPKGELGRIGLAIAPSKPDIIYALVEAQKNGLYRSTDGGFKWKLVSNENIGNRPFYYADIFVDPSNENRIFNLHSTVTISEDGGKTFRGLLPYVWNGGVHPDHHAFWIHPDDPSYLIEGNDGGLNISRDGGEHWRFVPNLPLAQFYHIDYDMDVPYHIAGGMQDNGSWVGPSSIWKRGGIRNSDWQEVLFGDGFDVAFRPDDNRYVYAMSQGGNLNYIDRETGRSTNIRPTHPDSTELRFNWNAALALDPFEPRGVYYGSQFVHYSDDCGQSWEILSPDLTTNDPDKQQQHLSGGLTIDDTRAENFTTILAIAPSPVDQNVIWVGTDDGKLQLTRDRGKAWTDLSDRLPGARAGSWIPYIELSQTQAGEAFVVVNDYRRNDWRPMVYHTTDFGATFSRIVSEEQVEGHALSIVQDPESPNLLWLGTDYGLYISIDKGKNWQRWTTYPAVSTRDLKIHPREADLIVGSFGRGAWILDDTRPLREIARTGGQVLDEPLVVFDAPDAWLAEYRSVDGGRFIADAEFNGGNRPSGALISLWVNPNLKKDNEQAQEDSSDEDASAEVEQNRKKLPDEVVVMVIDMAGDTIRRYSTGIDTGLVRKTWNLRRDGFRYPSRRKARKRDDLPSGRKVLPGDYKLIFQLGSYADSTTVTVHADPRLDISPAMRQAAEEAMKEYEHIVTRAAEAFRQIRDAREDIDRVKTALAHLPDSTRKDLLSQSKALVDSLNALEELYMLPSDFKGIRRSTGKLNSTLSTAGSYLGAISGEPNQAAKRSLDKARRQTRNVLERIHEFFESDYQPWREKVEATSYSLFKPYEPVRLD